MDRTWISKPRYAIIYNNFVYRQDDVNEMVNVAYTDHHFPDEEATDYDVPPKQYKNIRFNKETHPLSLMVYIHTYTAYDI